jgi:VIT1/CCC1 family predicted Fe2+/Mn2+ transporter
VQSSRELYQRELSVERDEIARFPEEELDELVDIYEARGLAAPIARQIAAHVMADDERALEVMAREELGIDPDELGGSAWTAATSSFALFVAGAAIPVVWFAFLPSGMAVPVSLGASALGLVAIGAAITRVTDRPPWRSGLRQLAIGLAAAAVTYATGVLLGVSVGA